MTTPAKITVHGYPSVAAYGDPDWPMDGECSRCGHHHFVDVRMAWVLPSDGGAERDLVVRAYSDGSVNVGILHVYDKWLDADEARAMAAALTAAADLGAGSS